MTTVRVTSPPRHRQPRTHEVAAALPRAALELAAHDGDPLTHADEPTAGAVARGGAVAVVRDLELDRVVEPVDVDPRLRRPTVLHRVRQRLLHQAIRRQIDARG